MTFSPRVSIEGVGRIYPQFHDGGEYLAARARNELPVIRIADERAALGHAVADAEGKLYPREEIFHLGVQRCPADDDVAQFASERFDEFLPDARIYLVVDARNLYGHFGHAAAYLGEYLLADDFLDEQRYGDDHVRPDTSILGAGILPRSETWAPPASGESMSMAQP